MPVLLNTIPLTLPLAAGMAFDGVFPATFRAPFEDPMFAGYPWPVYLFGHVTHVDTNKKINY